jgi:hypothetical protein
MERVKGIEPSYAAWEAAVLPLNYTRKLWILTCAGLPFGAALALFLGPPQVPPRLTSFRPQLRQHAVL